MITATWPRKQTNPVSANTLEDLDSVEQQSAEGSSKHETLVSAPGPDYRTTIDELVTTIDAEPSYETEPPAASDQSDVEPTDGSGSECGFYLTLKEKKILEL